MPEETAIKPFDINEAAAKMRAQIRSTFIEMMTEEQFQHAVKAELESFMRSGFREICREVFVEHVKEQLRLELGKPDWYGEIEVRYTSSGEPIRTQCVGDAVRGWLTANSQQLVQSVLLEFMGSAAQRVVQQAIQRTY